MKHVSARQKLLNLERGLGYAPGTAPWWPRQVASAIPSRRADDAEGGSAGTEGSAVPQGDAQTQVQSQTPHGDS